MELPEAIFFISFTLPEDATGQVQTFYSGGMKVFSQQVIRRT